MAQRPDTPLPRAHVVAEKVFSALERFLHVEAVSGAVLLIAAAAALLWANSSDAHAYHHLWEAPLTLSFGEYTLRTDLHFIINDVLMSVFFLVVGMEIRREMHEGALSNIRIAALPLAAATGGVVVPALIYLGLNGEPALRAGWAVPTATDIAFAVGVLALLGRHVPGAVRIFLLALAIIDDIAAVVIIAAFYSGGLDYAGLLISALGVMLVLGLQKIGIGRAAAYVIPGALIWLGLLQTGVHPSLVGVLLGMMTPVKPLRQRQWAIDTASTAVSVLGERAQAPHFDPRGLVEPIKQLSTAQRSLLPPVVRVQMALHPWVAYGVMPLFALANAGVTLDGLDLSAPAAQSVMLGIAIALVLGKPTGIFLGTWLAVRVGWCRLPLEMRWTDILLIGFLGGIGFTMSIFIAMLAFTDAHLLAAAKSGVLAASSIAAVIGLSLGRLLIRQRRLRGAAPSAAV